MTDYSVVVSELSFFFKIQMEIYVLMPVCVRLPTHIPLNSSGLNVNLVVVSGMLQRVVLASMKNELKLWTSHGRAGIATPL